MYYHNFQKIALVGAGSLGTIIGALLTKNGCDLVLVDVNKDHVSALNEKGATIVGGMELTVPVKALTPHKMEGTYDLILYLVKTTCDDHAIAEIKPHLNKNSTVITFQNGVPEDKIANLVGKERTIGCVVGWGATLLGPGISRLTSEPEAMTCEIGEIDGKQRPRLAAIKNILDKAATTGITTNLIGMRWSKLMVNASLSGMSTALGCTFGQVLDNDRAATAAIAIAVETLKTAKVLGIKIAPIQGINPEIILDLIRQNEKEAVKAFRKFFGKHRSLEASMLQDINKGQKCEVEAINGYLSQKSSKAGVPTPVNDRIREIILDIQAGKYAPSFDNIEMIGTGSLKDIIHMT